MTVTNSLQPLTIDGDRPVLRIESAQALSAELVARVGAFVDAAADSPAGTTAVIHLTGGTVTGSDRDGIDVHLVSRWEQALRRLERLSAATVAVVQGDCAGVAIEVLLASDYRVATPEVRLLVRHEPDSVWPGMGLYRLANHAGFARIRRAALFGSPISATEAVELNLIDSIVDEPASGLAAAVRLVGPYSGPDLAIRRQLLLDATTTSFEEALGRHLAACDRHLRRAGDSGPDDPVSSGVVTASHDAGPRATDNGRAGR